MFLVERNQVIGAAVDFLGGSGGQWVLSFPNQIRLYMEGLHNEAGPSSEVPASGHLFYAALTVRYRSSST